MTTPAVTDWITGDPLADRPGWYDLRFAGMGHVFRVWWDGANYRSQPGAPLTMVAGVCSGYLNDQHRGLAAPAEA